MLTRSLLRSKGCMRPLSIVAIRRTPFTLQSTPYVFQQTRLPTHAVVLARQFQTGGSPFRNQSFKDKVKTGAIVVAGVGIFAVASSCKSKG